MNVKDRSTSNKITSIQDVCQGPGAQRNERVDILQRFVGPIMYIVLQRLGRTQGPRGLLPRAGPALFPGG